MSTFTTQKGITISVEQAEALKCKLLSAPDLVRDFTWTEIDGVRRVTQIIFTSGVVNIAESATVDLTRVFTYDGVDPFDLDKIEDALTVA